MSYRSRPAEALDLQSLHFLETYIDTLFIPWVAGEIPKDRVTDGATLLNN